SALGVAHDLEEIRRRLTEPDADAALQSLELATRDVPLRLSLPQNLYGRDAERSEMRDTFEHVERGGSAIILIGGASGAGKTSLILDMAASLLRSRSSFAEGKFEELRRDIPYDAIVR